MPQDSIKHRLPAAALTFALPTPPVRRANSLSQPVRALLIPSVRRVQLGSSKARRPRAACASEPPLSPVRLDLSRTDYSNLTVGCSRLTESICAYTLVVVRCSLHAPSMLSDKILWARASNKQCLNVFPTVYPSRSEAQAACVDLGTHCGGVEDLGCDDRNDFSLCTSGAFEESRAGSCVYTPAGISRARRYRWLV